MRRRLINIGVVLSLLISMATAAWWVSGYTWVRPSTIWEQTRPLTETRYSVTVGQGALQLDRLTPPAANPPEGGDALFGFGYERGRAYAGTAAPYHLIGDVFSIFIPFWFIVLVTAALPMWRVFSMVRAKLVIRAGHCRCCGYDLRATPNKCPECGMSAGAVA